MSRGYDRLAPLMCIWCETGSVVRGVCQNGDCGASYGKTDNRRKMPRRRSDLTINRSDMERLRRQNPTKNERRINPERRGALPVVHSGRQLVGSYV